MSEIAAPTAAGCQSWDFSRLGCQICAEARNGKEGLEKIYQYHPDIVFTDLKMPVMEISLGEMAKATMRMVTESIDSFVKQDLRIARKVIADDDIVDRLFLHVRDQLSHGMLDNLATREQMMDLFMIAKYYERIGDHATNIAEWVEFSITGQHRGEK